MRAALLLFAGVIGTMGQSLPVTINQVPEATAGGSFAPVLDGTGQYLAFLSASPNLRRAEGQYLEIFVHDFFTGQLRQITAPRGGVPWSGQPPHGNSQLPSFSAANGVLAFSSDSDALADGDTNQLRDIFLRDFGFFPANAWITRDSLGLRNVLTPGSTCPMISADGTTIAFQSSATNLVANDTNRIIDIFVFQLLEGFRVVSVGAIPRQLSAPYERSYAPSISADGGRVAFLSTALLPEGSNQVGGASVFVRDVRSNITWFASRNGVPGPSSADYGYNYPPVLSANGRAVVWKAASQFSVNPIVVHRDLESNVLTRLAQDPNTSRLGTLPAISADGQHVAYETGNQIYLWNAATGSNILVSVNLSGAPGRGISMRPVMMPDARFIAFLSTTTNLATNVVGNTNFQLYVRDLQQGVTRLASFNTNRHASLNGVAHTVPSISDDGMVLAFDYNGPDLVASDYNDATDVFVYRWWVDDVVLVSRRNVNPLGSSLTAGTATPELNSVSDDGRWVTFTAFDDPRIAGDTNRARDVFARDLNSGQLVNLSLDLPRFGRGRHALLSASGNAATFVAQTNSGAPDFVWTRYPRHYHKDLVSGVITMVDPTVVEPPVFGGSSDLTRFMQAISADGNLVVYERDGGQLYLRDITAGTNQLITVSRNGGPASQPSAGLLLSPDNRYVVFANWGGDLTVPAPGTTFSSVSNLYARDLSLGRTFLISAKTNGADLGGHSVATTFSASGRYLVFFGNYPGEFYPLTYLYDFETRRATPICTNCAQPYLSADARFVAYLRRRPLIQIPIHDVYVQELVSGRTWLASENFAATGAPNATASAPLISGDGRYVVFASRASDLVRNDTNKWPDIFVRDRLRDTTLLISGNFQGTASGNYLSLNPILSANGRTLIFQSFASDLVDGDYNRRLDIFRVHLGAGDSDSDGMDDNWEQTYFGTLDRDGTGDLDSDGQSDLAEYLAGTDPTNLESVFEVFIVESAGGQRQVVWSSVPGKTYMLQSRNALSDPEWSSHPKIVAQSTTTSVAFLPQGSQRFFRVRLLPGG